MKQRITVEQLNELSDGQKGWLREWWKPEKYNDVEVVWDGERSGVMEYWESNDEFGYGPYFTPRLECLPLLSIGQCLELLYERNQTMDGVELNIYNFQGITLSLPTINSVPIYKSGDAYSEHEIYNEPIDALFAAVKQIL